MLAVQGWQLLRSWVQPSALASGTLHASVPAGLAGGGCLLRFDGPRCCSWPGLRPRMAGPARGLTMCCSSPLSCAAEAIACRLAAMLRWCLLRRAACLSERFDRRFKLAPLLPARISTFSAPATQLCMHARSCWGHREVGITRLRARPSCCAASEQNCAKSFVRSLDYGERRNYHSLWPG